ncbi:MAG: M48 family metalloprotease [Alphaproteobacteria bacterium]|nr:M48 family metalloprotease [Alphaproteobacteria bacterium]
MKQWTISGLLGKTLPALVLTGSAFLYGCSVNPATGKSQFAALMPPQQESSVGAQEHEKILAEFKEYNAPALQAYVREVGRRVTQDTERPDVQYKFFVLDSPVVNAFALPGGYIYVSRGLLALANSEAELAAVLAHETGHITARHTAERYSTGMLTSLGAAVISAAVDSSGVTRALDLGNNLYLSSYSRGQENEADSLGLRYMTRGGYDAQAMPSFLASMQAASAMENQTSGRAEGLSYFSTHPPTGDRVAKTTGETGQYSKNGVENRDAYLRAIDGMIYGDSPSQGFVRGQRFVHPEMGFMFEVPPGFTLVNQSAQVVATSPAGAAIIFDMESGGGARDPSSYLSQVWMKGQAGAVERISVNGMPAATAAFKGQVNNRPATIHLIAIQWSDSAGGTRFARFQIAIPEGASPALVEDLKRASYSLRRMDQSEKAQFRPYHVRIVTAGSADTAASLSRRQPFENLSEQRFRVLNGLGPQEALKAGASYKIIEN